MRRAQATGPKPQASRSPLVIPIFIPHQGCPHRCLFCNQQPITGVTEQAPAGDIREAIASTIELWIKRSPRQGRRVQVAFYGGSFTGLPRGQQHDLLSTVTPFIRRGQVDGIRLSTRPDYVDDDTPAFLLSLGVETVELGVQSMEEAVLKHSQRGHDVDQIASAIAILKEAGLTTGTQLMLGLPGETTASACAGARRLASLRPDFARLYPVLVIRGSGLEGWYRQGRYRPLSLWRAVVLAGRLTLILAQQGIKVVRTGLQPSAELEANLVAGPYHPAFGELVKSRLFFNELRRQLTPYRGQACRLTLAGRDRSLFSGQRRCSEKRLEQLHLLEQTTVFFSDAPGRRGRVEVEGPQPLALT